MSETVKRYALQECSGESGRCWAEMLAAPNGDYVAYADYAALAQQLADVAYLEEWRAADRLKHNIGHAPHDTEWHAYVMGRDQDSCYWGVMVSAPSLPALGARLRAMRAEAS